MVGVISAGLALLVAGETQFDALGFALVMAASALSGLRWTITQLQLQGSDGHGAALYCCAVAAQSLHTYNHLGFRSLMLSACCCPLMHQVR